MVTDATFIGRTEIGAFGLLTTMGGVWFDEEGEGEDAGLLMGEGSGVGEDVV